MKKLISCKSNIDTACVELRFADGTTVAIDTIVVENELNANTYQCSELDYLIYNKPWEYADLVLNDGLREYIVGSFDHKLEN